MKPEHPRLLRNPTSLKVVAALCVLVGVIGVWNTLLGISRSYCMIDLGLLGFFAARGLLRHRNGWRIAVLIITGLGLVVGTVFLLFSLSLFFAQIDEETPAPLIPPKIEQPTEGQSGPFRNRGDAQGFFVRGFRFGRTELTPKAPWLAAAYYLIGFALNAWVMYVLLRPEIHSLFVKTSPAVVGPDPAASPESPSSDSTIHE